MIKKEDAVKGAKFRIISKNIGVTLNKAGMRPYDIVVIYKIQNDPWVKDQGGSILACKEGVGKIYTFLPQDFVALV